MLTVSAPPPHPIADELFESHSLDDNELTAVDDKCKVLPWSQRRQDREAAAKAAGKKRKGGNKEGDGLVFYCRYMYDTSKCLLRPCLEDEAAFDFPSEVESDGTYSSESEGEGEEFSAKHNRTGSRPRRPSSSRKPKTKASPKGAPKAARRGANLTLPTAAAAATDPSTPLGAARRKLHVSTVPDALPCREVSPFARGAQVPTTARSRVRRRRWNTLRSTRLWRRRSGLGQAVACLLAASLEPEKQQRCAPLPPSCEGKRTTGPYQGSSLLN